LTRQAAAEATWVPAEEFRTLYPSYQLEDELLLQGGGDVMCGIKYQRRRARKAPTDNVRDQGS
jgi:hypothetical protein